MNHPLPKSASKTTMAYEFVKSESTAETAGSEAEIMAEPGGVGALQALPTPRRLREQLSMAAEADDPYEAYRQRILQAQADRVDHVKRTMPPLPAQPLSEDALERLRQRNYYYDPQQYYARSIDARPSQQAPEPFFSAGIWNRGVALAAIVAVVAGATVGFALTKKDEIGASATRTLAFVGGLLPADQPVKPVVAGAAQTSAASTVIAKKPIATASLQVADMTGSLNRAIALPFKADPAFAEQDLSIRISGLPEDAVLTPGRKISDQTWMLNDEDLGTARLVVPHAEAQVFDISVAAIETSTGELAAPVREMKLALTDVAASPAATPVPVAPANLSVVPRQVDLPSDAQAALPAGATSSTTAQVVQIAPANASPETQGAALPKPASSAAASPIPDAASPTVIAPAPSPVAMGLLQKGDVLFKAGDLMMARQFYLRAHDLGAAEGALGVARTYDPAVFKELKVEGLMPDAAQAREWYRKASITGLPEAVNALARFETTAALP